MGMCRGSRYGIQVRLKERNMRVRSRVGREKGARKEGKGGCIHTQTFSVQGVKFASEIKKV